MRPDESWADARIDAALRDVPVPDGLTAALRPEVLFNDQVVDRILADVPEPGGLAGRLWPQTARPAMPRSGPPRDAPARPRRGRRRLRAFGADVVAVAFSLGIVATMFVAGLKVATWTQPVEEARRPPVSAGAAHSAATDPGRPAPPSSDDPRLATGGVDWAEGSAGSTPSPSAAAEMPPRRNRPPSLRAAPVPLSDAAAPAAGRTGGAFPGMRVVPDGSERETAGRRSVPGMRGFDLAFEMAHGEAPFVDPSIAPGLAVDRPPLVVATDSFDRVWPLPGGRRRRAELDALRVEHVLAAIPARASDAAGDGATVGLSAVRSLRPGRPTYLVEVCIHVPIATAAAAGDSLPADATLVLDHSAAPGAVPLWLAACRGLAAAAARMTPTDRLTVVVAEPRPRVVAIRAGADEIRRIALELEEELPSGLAELDAAVTLARDVAAREGIPGRLIVVAHSERAEGCVGAGREAFNRWREAVRRDDASPTTPRFLLVSGVPDGSPVALAGMPGWTLSDPTTLRRRLVDLLAAGHGAALERAMLEVRFDPAMIAAYRLIGHRQSVPESLSAFGRTPPDDSGVAIHEGEAVRAVYEVVPRQPPRGRLDGIAATLTARDASGAVRLVAARAALLDPALGGLPSAAGCELVLAVAVGEFPGRSTHAVPKRAAIEGVRGIAQAWEERGDVTALGRRLVEVFDDRATGGGVAAAR
jgi:hypothetical protein